MPTNAGKAYDCVRMMRDPRDDIDREVEDLTPEQRVEYIRRRAAQVRSDLGLPEPVSPGSRDARVR